MLKIWLEPRQYENVTDTDFKYGINKYFYTLIHQQKNGNNVGEIGQNNTDVSEYYDKSKGLYFMSRGFVEWGVFAWDRNRNWDD